MNVAQARRAVEHGRGEHHRACRLAPLPASVSPLEAALQEMLLDHGHRNPLSTAARMADTVLRQQPPAIGTDRPLPPEQWSAGITSPTTLTGCDETSKLRAWLWQHTAQPNGDPWSADPDHLDRAAQDLAATLWRTT